MAWPQTALLEHEVVGATQRVVASMHIRVNRFQTRLDARYDQLPAVLLSYPATIQWRLEGTDSGADDVETAKGLARMMCLLLWSSPVVMKHP